jgi:diphthamide biosynthesis methyltransferase
MLYLVGLGLADEKDITVKGLEVVKKAERVYLEAYTAVLLVEKDVLVRTIHHLHAPPAGLAGANCHGSRKLSMAAKSS